ncbi:MAG TPA: tail fiber protein, partial [Thermoanaerobaculia bacterium]|nr:tail fiber protein [Thermoanaerobaculia bacterium]
MAQPYIGEIRLIACNYAPTGWMFCDGSLLPISENDALFTIIGTRYGGDGESNFALPDLRGRIPIHRSNSYIQGTMGGVEEVTLTTSQMPVHTHSMLASSSSAQGSSPTSNLLATTVGNIYNSGTNMVAMRNTAISPLGGSQPHTNLQPYL